VSASADLRSEGNKPKLATIWLDGCSGCHMSLLDIDERLLSLTARADLVYGCLVDAKEFPENVDITLVEGAVSSTEDLRRVLEVRQRTRLLVALGDCAVTSNVPGMRNSFGPEPLLRRAYVENADLGQGVPIGVPALLEESLPVHAYVKVDVFLPGCPPSADRIFEAVNDLLDGRSSEGGPGPRFG
jgi:NAD-reducing hydrogenase small subunit